MPAGDASHPLPQAKGEFVVVIGPGSALDAAQPCVSDEEIAALFGQIANNVSSTRREAIKSVAQRLSLSSKAVYAALERAKPAPERIG